MVAGELLRYGDRAVYDYIFKKINTIIPINTRAKVVNTAKKYAPRERGT